MQARERDGDRHGVRSRRHPRDTELDKSMRRHSSPVIADSKTQQGEASGPRSS